MDNDKRIQVGINTELIMTTDLQKVLNADWESLVQMGQEAGEIKIYAQWILGMLGYTVNRKYGDLKKYASEIRQDYGSLRQYVNTYRKFIREDPDFHPAKYYGSVPWGVLALAATKSDQPQKLVDDLQKEGKEVSLKTAYREIKRRESPEGQEPPQKPVIKLLWVKETNLYKLIIDPKYYPSIDWTAVKSDLKDWLNGLS